MKKINIFFLVLILIFLLSFNHLPVFAHPIHPPGEKADTFEIYEDQRIQQEKVEQQRMKTQSKPMSGFESLLKNTGQNEVPGNYIPPNNRTDLDIPITKRVMVITFNPTLENLGNQTLTQYMDWNDHLDLENRYIQAVNEVTNGVVNYQIVHSILIDDIPRKADPTYFHYPDLQYISCVLDNPDNCFQPDRVDYNDILTRYQVCEKRNRDEIDELWLWGGPYFGFLESTMAGPNAFSTNGGVIENTTCQKQLHVMGFNYSSPTPNPANDVFFMLQSLGHRIEGTMFHLFGGEYYGYVRQSLPIPQNPTLWDKYSKRGFDGGIVKACSHVHGSLNAPVYDPSNPNQYDWTNRNIVSSLCEDWFNYPSFSNIPSYIYCDVWGCNAPGAHRYWLSHIPKYSGRYNNKWNNWWRYVLDYEGATEWTGLDPIGVINPPVQNSCTISGWTCDPNSYATPLTVKIYEGNILLTTKVANEQNNNGGYSCSNYSNHGYSYTLPFTDNRNHTITVKVKDIAPIGTQTGINAQITDFSRTVFCPGTPPSPTPSSTPSTCPNIIGDADGDCRVNLTDYNIVRTHFGQVPVGIGDLNRDGRVNLFDMNLVIQNYSPQP